MSETIDPVGTPDAYRASLLAELGDDDPAVVQAETPSIVRALVADAGDLLRVRPEPGEWSVLECIGHIADGELVVATRERWILAEDVPDIVGYDQALWVDRLDHNADDPDVLLAMFEAVREANLDLWARRPERGSRPGGAPPRARRRELRADVPARRRPRPRPCRAGAPGARGGQAIGQALSERLRLRPEAERCRLVDRGMERRERSPAPAARCLASEVASADLGDDRPRRGVAGIGSIAWVGLDDGDVEDVASDRGAGLGVGARDDHAHVCRQRSMRWRRSVAWVGAPATPQVGVAGFRE